MAISWLTAFSQKKASPEARKRVYLASVIGASVTLLSSYWLEYLANATAPVDYIGSATVLQFLLAGFFMLSAYAFSDASKRTFITLIAVAVLLRLALIPVDSYTSNDTARYLFDGKLAIEGFDPYRIAHDEPQLAELKEQWAPPAEHTQYVTLYPPLALALFSISASFGVEHAELAWKLIVTLFSVLTLLLGAQILNYLNKRYYLPLLALSPLLILESGVGAHLDTISAFSVLLVVWAYLQKRMLFAGLFIAIGTAIKLLPFGLLGPLVLLLLFRREYVSVLKVLLSTSVALITIYGVSFILGLKPIGSIGIFFQKWRFGSPLFDFLEHSFSGQLLLVILATLLVFGILAISIFLLLSKQSHESKLLISFQCILALPLLISPVVFPWYLMVLAVIAAIRPSAWLLSWILLAPLTYEVLNQFLCCNIWNPAAWPLVIIALITGSVLLLSATHIYVRFYVRAPTQTSIDNRSTKRSF